jgi:phosphohistidine phosphatase
MKLYLMRHGQASDVGVDPDQGLSANGRSEVQQLANRLVNRGLNFTRVYHSSKARARQTAEIMRTTLSPGADISEHTSIKPNDNPDTLISDINGWHQDVLVVSHLPFLPTLITKLTGDSLGSISFQPATLICLVQNNQAWELEWVVTP